MYKYFIIFKLAAREWMINYRSNLLRGIFLIILCIVFSKIYLKIGNFNYSIYIGLSQWFFFSLPSIAMDISRDIKNYNFQKSHLIPIFLISKYFIESFAVFILQSILYLSFIFLYFVFLKINLVVILMILIKAMPLYLLAGSVLIMFQLLIGFLGGWTDRISILTLLWQKFSLVLGGVILPMSLFPPLLKQIVEYTPFPWLFGNLTLSITNQFEGWDIVLKNLFVWLLLSSSFVFILKYRLFKNQAQRG